jgi:ubiquitin-protein ligase E3 C
MSPRLGVLNNIPFAIPFEVRVSIFRHFVANDMITSGRSDRRGRRTRVSVRRGSVAQDGFDRLEGADLKAPIEITFIDQFGQEECVVSFFAFLSPLLRIERLTGFVWEQGWH